GDGAVEDLLVLVDRLLDVVEEGLLVDRAGGGRPGVDHPAARLEQSVLAGEVVDEARGRRNVETRRQVLGVEIEGREVELDLRIEGEQLELADSLDFDQRVERKG